MTEWFFVAMLYAQDGTRHYRLGDHWPHSDQCFAIADQATKQLMAARAGWATCMPEDVAKKLTAAK